MKITSQQKKQLQKVGKKYKLKLVLLHGSYATGKACKESDLDIAVFGKKPIDFEKLLKLHGEIANIFGDNESREIDLKPLHQADPLFCYQVAKNSQLLYGSSFDYDEFRAYAFKAYYDAKDLFNLEHKLIKKYQDYLNRKYG